MCILFMCENQVFLCEMVFDSCATQPSVSCA
jgi:hypothetical protein